MTLRNTMLAAATFVAAQLAAEQYKVIVPASNDENGRQITIIDLDTGLPLDSVTVSDGSAVLRGDVDEPVLAFLSTGPETGSVFVLEPGTISFSKEGMPFGTMTNDRLRSFTDRIFPLIKKINEAPAEERQSLIAEYNRLVDEGISENDDSPLGFYIFMNTRARDMDASQLRAVLKQYPDWSGYKRFRTLLTAAERYEATLPGGKMLDFEVSYDGRTQRLSDYVGHGKYVLVDFWASWCGPCMRQAAVLKDIYNKYKDTGRLDVLGVAVWDEPENTLEAIRLHDLPWDNIINAQSIPTEIYGIDAIPCIILFGPDGTILSRGKQGDELRRDVDKALR